MKVTTGLLLLLAGIALLMGACSGDEPEPRPEPAPTPEEQPEPGPDSTPPARAGLPPFKCYEITNGPSPGVDIAFETQFGGAGVTVRDAELLCVPAEKTLPENTKPAPVAKGDHLHCYNINSQAAGGPVILTSQFGEGPAAIAQGKYLCEPSDKTAATAADDQVPGNQEDVDSGGEGNNNKTEENDQSGKAGQGSSREPEPKPKESPGNDQEGEYDQYDPPGEKALEGGLRPMVCHPIRPGATPNIQVTLADQFGAEKVNVGLSDLMCTPLTSKKIHLSGDGPKEVEKPDHLVCYRIDRALTGGNWALSDQFGKLPRTWIEPAKYFCDPSRKDRVIE